MAALVGDGPPVGDTFSSAHEEPEGVEPGENRLDRDAVEGAPVLANLAQHVLDAMGEVSDQLAPDGVGGALERVDCPEQARDLVGGGAVTLQRDAATGPSTRDARRPPERNTRARPTGRRRTGPALPGAAPYPFQAPGGVAGTMRSSASAIASPSSAPVAPITSSAVFKREHHIGQRREPASVAGPAPPPPAPPFPPSRWRAPTPAETR